MERATRYWRTQTSALSATKLTQKAPAVTASTTTASSPGLRMFSQRLVSASRVRTTWTVTMATWSKLRRAFRRFTLRSSFTWWRTKSAVRSYCCLMLSFPAPNLAMSSRVSLEIDARMATGAPCATNAPSAATSHPTANVYSASRPDNPLSSGWVESLSFWS